VALSEAILTGEAGSQKMIVLLKVRAKLGRTVIETIFTSFEKRDGLGRAALELRVMYLHTPQLNVFKNRPQVFLQMNYFSQRGTNVSRRLNSKQQQQPPSWFLLTVEPLKLVHSLETSMPRISRPHRPFGTSATIM
jgi:hypothetical protein